MIIAIVLVIVRPGSSQGDEPDAAAGAAPSATADPSDEPTAPPTVIPTEATEVDGDACTAKNVTVEAVTDKTVYEAGVQHAHVLARVRDRH